MIHIILILLGFILAIVVASKGYQKHSLSFGGAVAATIVGIIHILSGWRITLLLLFFYGSSSKLTKMWANIKKQREDNFHYGGERKARQVIANSFIPTLFSLFLILSKWSIIQIKQFSIEYLENLIILPTILSYYTECCADTWGSEVGIISSTPYLLLLPWKPVPAGTNGGISILGLGAACASAICMTLLYFFIQPSTLSITFIEILEITFFSAIFGTFIDSFLGSILEESWWCATKKKIIHIDQSIQPCCEKAMKENRKVQGFIPSECGLVCGKRFCSGNTVNLLSSTITSLFVFMGLFYKYLM